jgi:hypothetical protein
MHPNHCAKTLPLRVTRRYDSYFSGLVASPGIRPTYPCQGEPTKRRLAAEHEKPFAADLSPRSSPPPHVRGSNDPKEHEDEHSRQDPIPSPLQTSPSSLTPKQHWQVTPNPFEVC